MIAAISADGRVQYGRWVISAYGADTHTAHRHIRFGGTQHWPVVRKCHRPLVSLGVLVAFLGSSHMYIDSGRLRTP